MRNYKSVLALALVILLGILSPLSVMAYTPKGGEKPGEPTEIVGDGTETGDEVSDVDGEEEEIEVEDEEEGNEVKPEKPWVAAKKAAEAVKDTAEAAKDAAEKALEDLEAQLEAAKAGGDAAVIADLEAKIAAAQTAFTDAKAAFKTSLEAMKAVVKDSYSEEELTQLEQVAEKIKKDNPNIKVLPVSNVLVQGGNVKFDTPPVIKDGRLLFPVRALSEAFGATVAYDAAARTVTITKDDKVIVLSLESKIATLNGVEFPLDVAAGTINSRTVVPMRFIVEKLGLKAQWDDSTETVEITPEDSGTGDETGTGTDADTTTDTDATADEESGTDVGTDAVANS